MKSKAYHALQSKLSYFDDDIELIDVLRKGVESDDLTDPQSNHVLKHIDPSKHKHITRRRNSPGSRKLLMNHLRASVYSSYVKDVYEEVTHYLRTILRQASLNGFNAGRIVGEHSFKVDAKTVLQLGSWDAVCTMVTESVFQFLEAEKSTIKLLEKMANKLALKLDQSLLDAALPYLEIRHFLVHTDGKVSHEFSAQHPHISLDADGYVVLNYSFITGFRNAVKALMAAFDQEVISTNLLRTEDLQMLPSRKSTLPALSNGVRASATLSRNPRQLTNGKKPNSGGSNSANPTASP